MLVDRKKEWNSYKLKVVIRKGGRKLLWKLIGKRSINEVVRLECEVVIFKFGMVQGWPYDQNGCV